MEKFMNNADKIISEKRVEIEKLQTEIREICFECISKQKDIKIGDMIYIPSKNKYAIFVELHNEDVHNQVIKTNLLTKQGLPSKNITTVSLNDLEKVTDSIENIINSNFSGEDFNAEEAILACKNLMEKLK